MKITTTYLRQVIKEEIEKAFEESRAPQPDPEKIVGAKNSLQAALIEDKWNMRKVEYLQKNPEKYEEFAAAAEDAGLIDPTNSNLFKNKEEFIAAVKQGLYQGGVRTNINRKLLGGAFPSDRFFKAWRSILGDDAKLNLSPDEQEVYDKMNARRRPYPNPFAALEEGQTKTVQGVIDDLAANDAKRRMALPDIEACAEGYGDPGIKQFYPGWTEKDFQAVVDGLKVLEKHKK